MCKTKWLAGGGLGTVSAGAGVLFMKCPLCWLAMGSATLAAWWPWLALPTVLLLVYRLGLPTRAACAKQSVH